MAWAVEIVARAVPLPISADTTRASVVAAALSAGARIVNDVSGLRGDGAMADLAAQASGVVLMAAPDGGAAAGPLDLVRRALADSLRRARAAGIAGDAIVLDPGLGFFVDAGMTPTQFNVTVLRQLGALTDLGHPLLVGVSRKRFIGELTGRRGVAARLSGSLAATAIAVLNGAAMVRTHDVAATRDAVRVAQQLRV
jgi:dihydropteroate synthase